MQRTGAIGVANTHATRAGKRVRSLVTLESMALHSHMVPLGTPMPSINLPNLDGDLIDATDLADGKPLVVMFVCNHCPYVRHVEAEVARVYDTFKDEGIEFVAISSNDIETHPDDDVAGLQDQVQRTGWGFPYLMDADQSVAKAFSAACTPDFFVYDRNGELAYRGALDASNPKNGLTLDGADLRNAISCVLKDVAVPEQHRPSMGCGIKWKPGNEPEAVSFV